MGQAYRTLITSTGYNAGHTSSWCAQAAASRSVACASAAKTCAAAAASSAGAPLPRPARRQELVHSRCALFPPRTTLSFLPTGKTTPL